MPQHKEILLDSSVIIAFVIPEDVHHEHAKNIFKKYAKATLLFTVYEEVLAVLHHRFSSSLARKVAGKLTTNTNIRLVDIDKKKVLQVNETWDSLPQDIDFVDASLIWAQKKYTLPIATFDSHYKKNNCKVVEER